MIWSRISVKLLVKDITNKSREIIVQEVDLYSCHRLYNASTPRNEDSGDFMFNGSAFSLKWSKSICRSCPEGGKICRLKKSNSTEPETECIKGIICILIPYSSSFHLSCPPHPLLWFNIQILHFGIKKPLQRIWADKFRWLNF